VLTVQLFAYVATRNLPSRLFPAVAESIGRHFVVLHPQEPLDPPLTEGCELEVEIELPGSGPQPHRYLRCYGRVSFLRAPDVESCSIGMVIERMQFSAATMRTVAGTKKLERNGKRFGVGAGQ
jgi:hypothetical protein